MLSLMEFCLLGHTPAPGSLNLHATVQGTPSHSSSVPIVCPTNSSCANSPEPPSPPPRPSEVTSVHCPPPRKMPGGKLDSVGLTQCLPSNKGDGLHYLQSCAPKSRSVAGFGGRAGTTALPRPAAAGLDALKNSGPTLINATTGLPEPRRQGLAPVHLSLPRAGRRVGLTFPEETSSGKMGKGRQGLLELESLGTQQGHARGMETQEGGRVSWSRGSVGFGSCRARGQSGHLQGHKQRIEGHRGLPRHGALQPGMKASRSRGEAAGRACADELGEAGSRWAIPVRGRAGTGTESREPRKAGRELEGGGCGATESEFGGQ